MNTYCTLFDSYYLIKGLTMYHSLALSGEDFTLYIACFDRYTYDLLTKLNPPRVVLSRLDDFENRELLDVKRERTKGEYCWTCTPRVISYFLDRYSMQSITYLDADLYFYRAPSVLLDEFTRSKQSVMITEHRYTPAFDQTETAGIYCVQFITFTNDRKGRIALDWWAEKCLEWCFARYEEGKFGDQKYLDDWTRRFEGVHVLLHKGGGVAPWNVQQYAVSPGPGADGTPVIFYHFHDFTLYSNGTLDYGDLPLSKNVKKYIYGPYIEALDKSLALIRDIDPQFSSGLNQVPGILFKIKKKILRLIKSQYYVVKLIRRIYRLFKKR